MFACTKCNTPKPVSEFHKRSAVKRGHDAWCKSCKTIYRKGYYEDNYEKELLRSRKKSWNYQGFDLEHDEHERMMVEQNHCCKICGNRSTLHVDHDHQTGKVRGLLCPPCNKGLGHFKDNVEILQKAIDYLND